MRPLARAHFSAFPVRYGRRVVAVDVDLEVLVAGPVSLLELLDDLRLRRRQPAAWAASRCGSRSRWRSCPAAILPGQRTSSGTRNAPSQFEFFSLRKGVIAPSGHVFICGPLSVEYMHDGVVGDAQLVQQVEHHRPRACRARPYGRGSTTASARPARESRCFGGCVRKCIAGRVQPDEEGPLLLVLARDEVLGRVDELLVAGLHALLGQRTGILDLLLTHPSPARLLGGIVLVGRPGAHDAAAAEHLLEVRKVRPRAGSRRSPALPRR